MNEAPEVTPPATPGRLPPPDPAVLRPRTPEERRPMHWRVNLVLLLATLVTTIIVGAEHVGVPLWYLFAEPVAFLRIGMVFSFSVLGILGAHEMGHYLAARRHRVDVSLPFFIPIPIGFGTFGAVIRMREAIPSRTALFDIAVAGPLAGFAAALPILVLGVLWSDVQPPTPNQDGVFTFFGEPLIHKLLIWILRDDPPGTMLRSNPFAFAGWVAMLVTFFNLMPIGQLDGGHLRYALFGDRADGIQQPLAKLLALWGGLGFANSLLASFVGIEGGLVRFLLSWCSPAFFLWGVLLVMVFGRAGWSHPPVAEWEPLSTGRRVVAGLTVVVFILVFMPAPISTEIY